jgi:opacity protein-like surface antigen
VKYTLDGYGLDKQRVGYRGGVGFSYDLTENISFRMMGRYSYIGMAGLDNLMEMTAGLRYTF